MGDNPFNKPRLQNPFKGSDLGAELRDTQQKTSYFDVLRSSLSGRKPSREEMRSLDNQEIQKAYKILEQLKALGTKKVFFEILEDKEDKDLKRCLNLLKKQESVYKEKEKKHDDAIKGIDNMIAATESKIAATESKKKGKVSEEFEGQAKQFTNVKFEDHLEQLLKARKVEAKEFEGHLEQLKQTRKRLLDERAKDKYQILSKCNQAISGMVKGILDLRNGESLSESPERLFRGTPENLKQSVENLLKESKLSTEIMRLEAIRPSRVPPHSLVAVNRRAEERAARQARVDQLRTERDDIRLEEDENLLKNLAPELNQQSKGKEVMRSPAEEPSSAS